MNSVTIQRRTDIKPSQAFAQVVRQNFIVNIEHGLHARPCALLVKTLQRYHCSVEVEANGERASAKSVLGLMALGAACGSELSFLFKGDDAFAAMAAVRHLFATHFRDAY